MTTPKKIIAAAAAICAVSITAPAMAGDANMQHTFKKVLYEDLDLTSEAGQKRFKQRVKSAVRKVCATPKPHTHKERIDQRRCTEEATASASKSTKIVIARAMRKQRLASTVSPQVAGN